MTTIIIFYTICLKNNIKTYSFDFGSVCICEVSAVAHRGQKILSDLQLEILCLDLMDVGPGN